MNISQTKTLSKNQYDAIHQLWNTEYPIKLKDRFGLLLEGIDNYNHYIIENAEQQIYAWAVVFEKEKQIRFSIIIHPSFKKKGLGGMLIEKLKAEHEELYGWVIDHNNDLKMNGDKYLTPMDFYLKKGFNILHEFRIENEMISAVLIKWQKNN